MEYYGLILISVLMFGGCFALNDEYRKLRGSNFKISMESTCIGAVSGLVVLFAFSGFTFEFTPFTLLIAIIGAINGVLFSYCAFKALDVINLSLFSLFSMLGGMALPFLQGIIFYNEAITVGKTVCFLLILVALLLTVTKGEKKKGFIFYAGIFIFNGASGVLAKIFSESGYPKTSTEWYAIWNAICTALLSGGLWLICLLKSRDKAPSLKALSVASANGVINRFANYLLVIALSHVDASVQYPFVTGGVMIVSTLLCFFGDKKPSKKEILSVIIAFIGILALFFIPV